MTDEERDLEREKGRLRKKRMRERKKLEDWRDGMTDAQIEYDKVEKVVRQRKKRQERNGKEHLYDNLMAKRGMRELREFGEFLSGRSLRKINQALQQSSKKEMSNLQKIRQNRGKRGKRKGKSRRKLKEHWMNRVAGSMIMAMKITSGASLMKMDIISQ